MSIPFFFEPFRCGVAPGSYQQRIRQVEGLLSENQLSLALNAETIDFVDGGVLSNFPTDAFATGPLSSLPTIAISMSSSPPLARRRRGFVGTLASY
jgi:predicted acylesterase/phospholipase RssA